MIPVDGTDMGGLSKSVKVSNRKSERGETRALGPVRGQGLRVVTCQRPKGTNSEN